MKDAILRWTLPTTLTDGEAIPDGLIREAAVVISADAGANWTGLAIVTPSMEQEVTAPELEVGNWQFGLTIVLTDGRRSDRTEVPFNIPSEANPNEASNVTVTIE